jgi:hypothetical protein
MSPSASSTLVNVAEDAELRLVRLLAETFPSQVVQVSPTFVSSAEACITHGDASQLLKTIVEEAGAMTALLMLEGEEAISAFSLVCALLDRVDESSQMLQELCDAIVNVATTTTGGDAVDFAQHKLMLLSTLYNMRADPLEKCGLIVRMLQLAGTSTNNNNNNNPLGKLLSTEPNAKDPRLVALLEDWKVPIAQRGVVYKAAADASGATTNSHDIKQRFTLLFVETYQSAAVRFVYLFFYDILL